MEITSVIYCIPDNICFTLQNIHSLIVTVETVQYVIYFVLTIACFWLCACDVSANHTCQVWHGIVLIFLSIDL
jgi:hypothetical protein